MDERKGKEEEKKKCRSRRGAPGAMNSKIAINFCSTTLLFHKMFSQNFDKKVVKYDRNFSKKKKRKEEKSESSMVL